MKRIALLATLALTGCLDETDPEFAEVESAVTSGGWTDDVQIPNQHSARQVGLAYHSTKLAGTAVHMVHAGSSSPNELWWSKFTGTSWSTNIKLSMTSDATPALASHDDRLYMAYKKPGEGTILVSSSATGSTWTSPSIAVKTISGSNQFGQYTLTPHHAPALAVHEGSLYLATCIRHDNGRQSVDTYRYTGTTWERFGSRVLILDGFECTGVALASVGGNLHLMYNESLPGDWLSDRVTSLMAAIFADDGHIIDDRYTGMDSARPASLASCGGTTYVAHSGDGSPSEIWVARRMATATDWPTDYKLNNQTSNGGPAIACWGTKPIMVHNGGTHQLWWARFL